MLVKRSGCSPNGTIGAQRSFCQKTGPRSTLLLSGERMVLQATFAASEHQLQEDG